MSLGSSSFPILTTQQTEEEEKTRENGENGGKVERLIMWGQEKSLGFSV